MALIETWVDCYLGDLVKIQYLEGNVFSMDRMGNRVGVTVYDTDGNPAGITGTVTGHVIRSDGNTVAVAGSRDGNKCWVDLPQACYYCPGTVVIAIKLTSGTTITTLACLVSNVYQSYTGSAVDPGTIISSIDDLIADIEAAVASIPADYSALWTSLAPAFNSSENYVSGQYVTYNGGVYRFNTTHSGSWSSGDVVAVNIGNELLRINHGLNAYISTDNVEALCDIMGRYYSTSNNPLASGAYRTSDYIEIPPFTSSIKVGNSFVFKSNHTKYYLAATVLFYDSTKTFISAEPSRTTDWVTVTSIPSNAVYVRINQPNQYNANIEDTYHGVWFIIDTWKFMSVAKKQILVDGADLHDLEPNKVYNITNSSANIANKPYNSFTGIVATIRAASANTAQFVFAMDGNRRVFVCNSWGAVPGTYNTWKELLGSDGVKKVEGFVGSFTATFPYDSKPFRYSEITMQPNTTYRIKFIQKPQTVRIYVHGYGNGTNYKFLQPWENELYFTNDSTARIIGFFPVDGIDPGMLEESFTVEVYTADSVLAKADDVPRVYKVAKDDKQADFTSVTACFLALKDDHNPKIVEIYEGDYDIYAEYVAANVPVFPTSMKRSEPYIEDGQVKYHDVDITPQMNFPEYCVFIPENTHVIGHGVVRLIWSPNPANDPITWMQCNAVSPVNVMGSMTLENVEIVCKNGRYCIHNDTIGLAPYAATTLHFINVKCYKYTNDTDSTTTPGSPHSFGYTHTIGYGLNLSMHHEYDNCDFYNSAGGRAFYGHTNQKYNGAFITEAQSGEIILKNCIMDTNGNECVKLGNSGTVQRRVRVKFDDCYFSGQINATNEGGETPVANAYDITFLNCGDVSVHYQDPNNPYIPKGYRTNITIN